MDDIENPYEPLGGLGLGLVWVDWGPQFNLRGIDLVPGLAVQMESLWCKIELMGGRVLASREILGGAPDV